MSIDLDAIEVAISKWINTELSIQAIKADQGKPKPLNQFATYHVIQNTPNGEPGSDSKREINDSITFEHSTLYNMMVSINIIRGEAQSSMIQLVDSLSKITVQDTLWADGLAFANTSDIRSIDEILDKGYEDRSQADFFFAVRSLVSETIDEIKEIELTNEIDDTTTTIQ